MKTNYYNAYSYKELLTAATDNSAEQIDVDTLGAWFSDFGDMYWNGEYYNADGRELWPVVEWDDENDCGEIVHYEFR